MRRGAGWYRGDCHVHSTRSVGGELTPGELVRAARGAGLDFIATTEHNCAAADGDWARAAGDGLLVVLGEEVVTRAGHWLALGIRPGQVVDPDAPVEQGVAEVRAAGGVCVAAHPYAPYPSGRFTYPVEDFDVVEVWNGLWASDLPWNADNGAALAEWGRGLAAGVRAGAWQPAIGNSDAHLAGQIGVPQTVVFAEELTGAAVLAGIRAGRSWVAGSAEVDVTFTASCGGRVAGVGERLSARGAPVEARVEVHGVPGAVVTFHTNRGEVHGVTLAASGEGVARWVTTPGESTFIRAEVRAPDGPPAALTNPILLT
ncbi:CehA/McbA family metallohydrolase [Streptomyces sp. CA-111067]|uniref:CehA/McbA family metallohydrolase n=1 Tax=Streptomyces sp. CA-111067 TaxID=3240046 RepID=UPI003D9631FC